MTQKANDWIVKIRLLGCGLRSHGRIAFDTTTGVSCSPQNMLALDLLVPCGTNRRSRRAAVRSPSSRACAEAARSQHKSLLCCFARESLFPGAGSSAAEPEAGYMSDCFQAAHAALRGRLCARFHLAARLPRMLPRRSPLVLPRRRRRPIGRRIFRQKETLLLFVERLASRCWRALLLGLRTASEPLSQGERRVVESTGRHVFDTE